MEAEFANEAFYLAFASKDMDAMTNVWSARDGIVCLHPGWPLLAGREFTAVDALGTDGFSGHGVSSVFSGSS